MHAETLRDEMSSLWMEWWEENVNMKKMLIVQCRWRVYMGIHLLAFQLFLVA